MMSHSKITFPFSRRHRSEARSLLRPFILTLLLNKEQHLFLLIACYCTFVAFHLENKPHYHSLSIQALPASFSLLFYSLSKLAAQSVRALTLGLCRVECRRFKPCSMMYFYQHRLGLFGEIRSICKI